MAKKIRFIVNPHSGASKDKIDDATIRSYLDLEIYDYDLVYTEYAGHAKIIAQEAVDLNYDTVVAVGGDGSINEVASQLVYTPVNLAIISAGSGNGFATNIGLSRNNAEQAINVINNRRIQLIDSCKVNDIFFINVGGVGFDGKVSYRVKNSDKRGLLMYIKTAIKESSKYEFLDMDIDIDGKKISGEYVTIAIANAAMYGYNFVIAPTADFQDGILDIIAIRKTSKIRYFLSSWRFLAKSLHNSKYVDVYTGKNIVLKSKNPKTYFHVDGEGYKTTEDLTFKVVPKSINLMVPEDFG